MPEDMEIIKILLRHKNRKTWQVWEIFTILTFIFMLANLISYTYMHY